MALKPVASKYRACSPKPRLATRSLLSQKDARKLEALFKVLGDSTRLRLLHALVRDPGTCVNELAKAVGMRIQAVSNQLQKLADRGVVSRSRNGNQIHYEVVDPCVVSLLDRGWCLSEDAIDRRSS